MKGHEYEGANGAQTERFRRRAGVDAYLNTPLKVYIESTSSSLVKFILVAVQ